MTSFSDLIEATGKELGYEIEIEDNVCAVGSEDITVLVMGIVENQEETVVMTTELGVPPPQRLEKLYETMMTAMYAHQTTAGASFARNPGDGSIWMQRMEPIAGLTPDMLIGRINDLGEAAATWKKIIEDYRDVSESSPESGFEEAPGFGNEFLQV